MVHRLASSKRDTKNASAASCRHMMVLPWKCRSLLPTSWAISQTSREKGIFQMRSSVLFWYPLDLTKGNCARPVLPGLLYLPCLQELLLWGLAPNGRVELPLGRLLPQGRWPGLCSHLGQLSGWWRWWWLPHLLQPFSLLNLPLSLVHHQCHLPHRWGLFGWGGVMYRRGGLLFFTLSSFFLTSLVILSLSALGLSTHLPSLSLQSFFGVSLVLTILLKDKKRRL